MTRMTHSLATALTIGLLAATPALAKGHDQGEGNGTGAGQDGVPGAQVMEETVAAAKTLGPAKGNSTNAPGKNK